MENEPIFVEYFGDSPVIRVLNFFIENDIYDYSKTDVFRHTGIARSTLIPVMLEMVRKGLLVETREVGRATMFKLNRGNPIVEKIVSFAVELAITAAKAELAEPLAVPVQ